MIQEDINDLMIKNMPLWQKKQLYAQNNNKELLDRIIKQAVKEEREACALILENPNICIYSLTHLARKIRARSNE